MHILASVWRSAPEKISCEAYNEAVQGALQMIRTGKKDILRQLREKMLAASERLDFENAALPARPDRRD